VEERSANVWVEGQDLGGMIVGARGQMPFVYVDNVLSRASGGESEAPDWLKWHVQHFLSNAAKGKNLFICRYRALIPWTFEPEQIFVGTYAVQWKYILTRKDFFPHGEIPSDTVGVFAFVVLSGQRSLRERDPSRLRSVRDEAAAFTGGEERARVSVCFLGGAVFPVRPSRTSAPRCRGKSPHPRAGEPAERRRVVPEAATAVVAAAVCGGIEVEFPFLTLVSKRAAATTRRCVFSKNQRTVLVQESQAR
jgi:hypothetical protein